MPRKDKDKWTTLAIEKSVLKKLDSLKVHPNQSYSEVIKKILGILDK